MAQQKIDITATFFLDTQTLAYFAPGFEEVATLHLTSEVIQDLEIVNESALERVINNWLQQTKIPPSQVLLLVSPKTYFAKQLPSMPVDQNDPEVQSFLDLVPFDDLKVNILPLADGAHVMAQNKLLIEPIVAVLERLGFKVVCITSAASVGMTEADTLTVANGQAALSAIDQVLTYNTLSPEQVLEKITVKDDFLAVKFDAKLIAMSVSFVLLILVLIGLIMYQRAQ